MKIDLNQKVEKGKETDWCRRIRAAIILEAAAFLVLLIVLISENGTPGGQAVTVTGEGYIKWVDFNVSYEALCKAYTYDEESYDQKIHLDWIELLAYVGAKCGGDFDSGAVRELGKIADKIMGEETTMEKATKDLKYYPYYKEAYTAVLGGLVGEYEIQETEDGPYVKKYGLKGFSPVAKGFEYSDYDDFGVSRDYGYRRQHLGHDMMGQIGTPM